MPINRQFPGAAHICRHHLFREVQRSHAHTQSPELSGDKVTAAAVVDGTDTRIIQVLPGHTRLETTARYTKVAAHVIAAPSPLDALEVKPKPGKPKQKPRK
jgi:hypothetical protein